MPAISRVSLFSEPVAQQGFPVLPVLYNTHHQFQFFLSQSGINLCFFIGKGDNAQHETVIEPGAGLQSCFYITVQKYTRCEKYLFFSAYVRSCNQGMPVHAVDFIMGSKRVPGSSNVSHTVADP